MSYLSSTYLNCPECGTPPEAFHAKGCRVRAAELGDAPDAVNHPTHYTSHPSGVECIQVTEHMGFNLGNAVKYIWRADLKGKALEDLRKAAFYIDREIQRREGVQS